MKTLKPAQIVKRIILNLLCLLTLFSSLSSQLAQAAVVAYQGRVTSNGTNFTGTGQFKVALVTSTNNSHTASATANLSGSFVTSYSVTSGGNGYLVAPVVTVTGGGGSGATAHAVLNAGVVTSVVADSAGTGYTSPPMVTIAAPPANITFVTYWSNDGTSVNGSEPESAVSASVTDGLFTLPLGNTSLANMMALNANVFVQPNLELRLWFNDGVNGFAALDPPQGLTHAPYAAYALNAASASNLTGTITSANIASGAVGTSALSSDIGIWSRQGNDVFRYGNVGIGTGLPGAPLEVRTTSGTGNAIRFGYSSGGVGNLIAGPSRVAIATGDLVERLSISQSTGYVGIQTTTPAYALDVSGGIRSRTVYAESSVVVGFNGYNGTLTLNGLNGYNSATLVVQGTAYKPGGGSWSSLSDWRLKKNIRPLAGALEKLLALRGVHFEYVDPEKLHELPGERIGLIAQEVEQVLPDWVETGPDGYKRVTVRGLEALVVEALRELRAEQATQFTEELKRRDAESAELKQRLEKLERLLDEQVNGTR
jgi:hypothetical protein